MPKVHTSGTGLPTRTRFSLPPIEKATGSVAGMTVRDFPRLARQWHPTKNGSLRPDDITAGQGLAVWWLCENGSDHEWTAQVRNRTISGARCPFCTGRRVAPSDALPATHPAVAAQWHPTKNGTQTAAEVSYGSDHYAWWQCDRYRTHVWRARINSRTGIIASGCRHCAELRGKGGRPPSPIRVPVAA